MIQRGALGLTFFSAENSACSILIAVSPLIPAQSRLTATPLAKFPPNPQLVPINTLRSHSKSSQRHMPPTPKVSDSPPRTPPNHRNGALAPLVKTIRFKSVRDSSSQTLDSTVKTARRSMMITQPTSSLLFRPWRFPYPILLLHLLFHPLLRTSSTRNPFILCRHPCLRIPIIHPP